MAEVAELINPNPLDEIRNGERIFFREGQTVLRDNINIMFDGELILVDRATLIIL